MVFTKKQYNTIRQDKLTTVKRIICKRIDKCLECEAYSASNDIKDKVLFTDKEDHINACEHNWLEMILPDYKLSSHQLSQLRHEIVKMYQDAGWNITWKKEKYTDYSVLRYIPKEYIKQNDINDCTKYIYTLKIKY